MIKKDYADILCEIVDTMSRPQEEDRSPYRASYMQRNANILSFSDRYDVFVGDENYENNRHGDPVFAWENLNQVALSAVSRSHEWIPIWLSKYDVESLGLTLDKDAAAYPLCKEEMYISKNEKRLYGFHEDMFAQSEIKKILSRPDWLNKLEGYSVKCDTIKHYVFNIEQTDLKEKYPSVYDGYKKIYDYSIEWDFKPDNEIHCFDTQYYDALIDTNRFHVLHNKTFEMPSVRTQNTADYYSAVIRSANSKITGPSNPFISKKDELSKTVFAKMNRLLTMDAMTDKLGFVKMEQRITGDVDSIKKLKATIKANPKAAFYSLKTAAEFGYHTRLAHKEYKDEYDCIPRLSSEIKKVQNKQQMAKEQKGPKIDLEQFKKKKPAKGISRDQDKSDDSKKSKGRGM